MNLSTHFGVQTILNHLQTGSIVFDLLVAGLVTQILFFIKKADLWKIFQKLVARIFSTPYKYQSVISYDSEEADVHHRRGSKNAFSTLCRYLRHRTKDLNLPQKRIFLNSRRKNEVVYFGNIKQAVLFTIPTTSFSLDGMKIELNEKVHEKTKTQRRGKDSEHHVQIQKTTYSIVILHNSQKEVEILMQKAQDHLANLYRHRLNDVLFKYCVPEERRSGSIIFQEFSSAPPRVRVQDLPIPPSEHRDLLKLLNDFKQRLGRFHPSSSNPRRLVFMLHGPPGNGKSSFIKSVINFFNISQVKVVSRLSIFPSDREFRKMFFSQNEKLMEEDAKPELVVFEELDAGDTDKVRECLKLISSHKFFQGSSGQRREASRNKTTRRG